MQLQRRQLSGELDGRHAGEDDDHEGLSPHHGQRQQHREGVHRQPAELHRHGDGDEQYHRLRREQVQLHRHHDRVGHQRGRLYCGYRRDQMQLQRRQLSGELDGGRSGEADDHEGLYGDHGERQQHREGVHRQRAELRGHCDSYEQHHGLRREQVQLQWQQDGERNGRGRLYYRTGRELLFIQRQ